jgi:sensor histidine kinase YesM
VTPSAAPCPPTDAATPPGRPPLDLRRLARRGLIVIAANVAIALLVSQLQGHAFAPSVVYAQCIGLPAWLVIELGLRLVPRDAAGQWLGGWRTTLLIVAGCVVGYFAGNALAGAILGGPVWPFAGLRPAALLADVMLTLAFGLAIGTAFFARARSEAQRALLEAAAHQATLARLQMLQSQLEPHMLFNTLANLRVLVGTRPDAAQAMLDRLIDFLRATLAGSRAMSHPLGDEFARIDDYLALMQVRMGDRLRVHIDLPAPLATVPVPPLLMQPLVENAIRHGLERRRGPGELWVRAREEAGRLVLSVEDTGAGLDAAPPDTAPAPGRHAPAGGFGLTQVRERLRTLHGDAAAFTLVPRDGGGAIAEIRMPMSRTPPQEAMSRP